MLQYHSGFGLDIGGDYTRYISNNNQSLLADYTDGDLSRFSMVGGQRIERYSVYADQKHQLSKEWNLGYGVSYRFAKDRDFQTYSQVTGDIYTQDTYSDLKEQTGLFECRQKRHVYKNGNDGGNHGVDGCCSDIPCQSQFCSGFAQDQQLVKISYKRIKDCVEDQPAQCCQCCNTGDFLFVCLISHFFLNHINFFPF